MTANIQSDCIEGRWGSYRRSAGTNYFISVCQVLEAEKCLRIKSLISIDKLNLSELQETFSDISELRASEVFENAGILIGYWHENNMELST